MSGIIVQRNESVIRDAAGNPALQRMPSAALQTHVRCRGRSRC